MIDYSLVWLLEYQIYNLSLYTNIILIVLIKLWHHSNYSMSDLYLIDHEFYPLSAMVYKCFNICLLLYRVYLEYLQVHVRSREIWWFWSLLRCRTTKTCQMSSYGWRLSDHYIELIFKKYINIWVSFPIPLVWGQSASCSRSYSSFTEEWSVCLAREICREEEHMSIDAELLTSNDMDARMRAEHILWPTEAQKQLQITRIPLDDQKSYLCYF